MPVLRLWPVMRSMGVASRFHLVIPLGNLREILLDNPPMSRHDNPLVSLQGNHLMSPLDSPPLSPLDSLLVCRLDNLPESHLLCRL